jgi:GAF domain-containing protein
MTNEQPQENNTQLPALLHPNKLLKGEREQRELAETLGRIGLILNATLDLSELIDIVCQESSQLFAVEAAYLGLVKDETLMRFAGPELSHQAFIQQRIPLDDPLTLGARVVRHKKPILINNAAHSPEVNPQLIHQFNLKAILGIPLLKGDEAIGVLVLLETVNPARFSQKDIELGLAFSSYAAIALQNACLFQATRRRAQQLTIINELSRDMGRVLEVKSLCEMVAQRVCVTLQYPHVDIFIVDPLTNQLVLQAIAGLYADKMQVGVYRQDYQAGLMGQTLRSGQTIFSNDTRLHPELIQLEGTTIGSEMVIPLIIREQAIGVLNISSDQFQAFDKDDVAVLTTVADQLAIAIDKSILFGETHRWAERLTSLQQVSQDLTALPDLQTLLHQIIKRALHLLGGQGGGIYLYRPESELLEHVVAIGHSPNNRLGVTVRAGEGMAGQVWLSGKPLLIEDYQTWVGKLPFWSEYPVTTLSVPIQGRAEFLGVLSIFADNSQHHYTPDDITLLAQFATQAAIAIR